MLHLMPRANLLGFFYSLFGNLKELLNYNSSNSIFLMKYDLEMLFLELEVLESFLVKSAKQRDELEELRELWTRIANVSYELECVIDSILCRDGPLCYHFLWLSAAMEEIKLIKAKVVEIDGLGDFCRSLEMNIVSKASSHVTSQDTIPATEEDVIGFNNEAEEIITQLTRGTLQMDIISIVGMPGIGNTTLAKKVYNTPSIAYHFYTRAWCCISQVYQRRELLLKILSDVTELTGLLHKKTDDDVAEVLRKCLKGKRYLIVLDYLWNIEAWKELRESFPNDNNGSRVLFTSRVHDVALQAKPHCKPYVLSPLSDDKSWELFQKKLFCDGGCPSTLSEVGKVIAQNCKGVPLSVVVAAGLLASTEKTLDRWKQISENLSSHIVSDPQRGCMKILSLSYEHLPDHLKSCFLYLGAFPEDSKIPTSKLFWLWIAEGFFQKTDDKSLEDAAEDRLMDLVDRSLVDVAKRRPIGRVKSCHLHDLLREVCLKKAKEEIFLQLLHRHDKHFGYTPDGLEWIAESAVSNPFTCHQRRLCICSQRDHFTTLKPSGPHGLFSYVFCL
ncbi:hypothetical protein ACH5RR_026478 [Cinchona calisaya]|uniref:Uncharacterized protein n=1 Tax=Cinchona calisaya TaxID=153742 RepID=A0ABD2Z4K4_9GENT